MSAIVVAVIAAVSSVMAAIVAGMYAMAMRRLDARLQRFDKAQEQIFQRKFNMYEPVINMLGHMFTAGDLPTSEEKQHKRRFDTWVVLDGSAGAVRAYARLMEAMRPGTPPDIHIRLYADFLLEVRNDIGAPDGTLSRTEILGTRLVSLSDPASLTDPDLDAVCRRLGWTPPWQPGR